MVGVVGWLVVGCDGGGGLVGGWVSGWRGSCGGLWGVMVVVGWVVVGCRGGVQLVGGGV